MSEYYLTVFKDDGYRHPLMTFYFHGREEFIPWPDKNVNGEWVNDEVSSIEYCLPSDWGVLLFKHRDPNHEDNQRWIGSGRVDRVDKDRLKWNDEASAHKWISKNGPCGW